MSFLRDYLEFNSGNEASQTYHLWAGLVVLSSIVSRRVWIDLGHVVIYGNLYVVLVGAPGNRKTTAMSSAKKMMREVGDIPFSAEAMSKEGLVKLMAEHEQAYMLNGIPKTCSAMTVCVTELKEFIGTSNERMINFLTTIFDQDFYDYKTRNMEDLTITNPYLTILACETPEWITLRLKDDVISGGFSRRAIFVYESGGRKRIAFPEISSAARLSWERALTHAKRIKNITGEFKWDPEAREFYKNWYENFKIPQDPSLVGYFESKHIQALKVAIGVAVSENTDLVMRTEYIKTALDILAHVETNLGKVFEGMGRNELNSVSSKILEVLSINREPMSEKQLQAVTWKWANAQEFTQILNHLLSSDKVTAWENRTTNKKFICLKGSEPADVRLKLAQADEKDPEPQTGQPEKKQLTQNEIMSLLRESPPVFPSASDAEGVAPPTDGPEDLTKMFEK